MIRLKVGKTYKARDGSIVTITYKDDFGSSAYPYKGDNGNTYADKGYHDISVEAHEWDLVEEVPVNKKDAIKLEVGKTYKDREGNVVTIVSKGSSFYPHPYVGDNASSYMEDGRFREYDLYHDYDLIEEVPAIGMFGSTWIFNNLKEEQTMKLEVGKSYKNRGGDVVSIVNYFSTHNYPYQDESGNTYLEDGTALQGQTSFRDLVQEHFVVDILGDKYTFKATAVEEPKQQEEQTMQDQIVTLNCTLTVTTAYGEPRLEIYPKDEAWRASSVCTVLDDNFELVLPRSKIEELYTDKLLVKVKKADADFKVALAELEAANNFLDSL